MKSAWVLWTAGLILAGASLVRADDAPRPIKGVPSGTLTQGLPPEPLNGAAPANGAPANGTPAAVSAPSPLSGPAPFPPVGAISCHRCPIWSWLTYQPARRPILYNACCIKKAPNFQPPLYDYFPCTSAGCGDCPPYPGIPAYNDRLLFGKIKPCNGGRCVP